MLYVHVLLGIGRKSSYFTPRPFDTELGVELHFMLHADKVVLDGVYLVPDNRITPHGGADKGYGLCHEGEVRLDLRVFRQAG